MTETTCAFPLPLAAAGETAVARPRLREDDRAAIEACQRGDREAFDRLVQRYQRDVYRLCYRYLNNHEDADDVAQEVFLRAYRAIGRFRGESAFSTWLYRIAVNACLNFRAARKPSAVEFPDTIVDPRPGAQSAVERDERSRRVRDAVSRLPEKQRATVILKVYHDLTHEEVAGILGSTGGTVKANLFHALGNLKKTLGGAAGER